MLSLGKIQVLKLVLCLLLYSTAIKAGHISLENIQSNYTRSLLFVGPPATGKTFMASALEGEICKCQKNLGSRTRLSFRYWGFADLVRFGLESVIEYIREHAPCVVFLDDLDAFRLNKVPRADLLVKELVAIINAYSMGPDKPVWILGAAHHADDIDPLLKNAHLFNTIVSFDVPTLQERSEFLDTVVHEGGANRDQINAEKLLAETDGWCFNAFEYKIKEAVWLDKLNRLK